MCALRNPILRGFYPDPSICRKGEDYYLVTSTFEYFPAVPVFHSKDLAHWHQVGSCISDPTLIDLNGCRSGKGIYAPTIRYNEYDDTFYMITTLVHNDTYSDNETFFMRAKNPAGPWYGKTVVSQAEGIDPSLFFEGEKAYYIGNMRPHPEDPTNLNRHVWIDEIDLATGRLEGKKRVVLKDGAVHDAVCPEGPHLYRFGDYYYILLAEGGTEHNHAQSVFRSKDVFGPYELNPRNPILTHRMLSRDSEFNSLGHADLVQTQDGDFWAIMLGVRPYIQPFLRNIGRETFLAPVIWEDQWPVFCPETGKVENHYETPVPPEHVWKPEPMFTSFKSPVLEPYWQTLRTPKEPVYSVGNGRLALKLNRYTIRDNEACAFIGRRQQEMRFISETAVTFTPSGENECAGMILLLNSDSYYLLVKTVRNGSEILQLSYVDELLHEAEAPTGTICLRLLAEGLDYWFEGFSEKRGWERFGPVLDGTKLSMLEFGFTGTMIGLYASANGMESDNTAEYQYFSYEDC